MFKYLLPTQKQLMIHLLTTDIIKWNKANLSGADLRGANLSGANLSGADLIGADLIEAYLRRANLWGANLSGAYLRRANLWGANLSGAYLSGANLWRANLGGADLIGANLSGANLSGADLIEANLRGANLSNLARYIIDYGQESRGYRRVVFYNGKEFRIMAGCRYFTIDEAINHWGSKNYPAKERGKEYLKLIERIKEDVKERGWE